VADELVIGTIVGVDEHPGARAPSLLLRVDLGTYGTHEVVFPAGTIDPAALKGAQIACRRVDEGATILGAHSHATGFVPIRPWDDVEPGTLLS
jgi:hypothetical protein